MDTTFNKNFTYMNKFWEKVNITENCWIWTGRKDKDGYGLFKNRKYKISRAHRFAFLITHGKLTANLFVCHTCDNTSCVRPSHLFEGTCKENVQDSIKKGTKWGNPFLIKYNAINGRRKRRLTFEKAEEIRKKYKPFKYSVAKLVKEYGITHNAIDLILKNITYRNI